MKSDVTLHESLHELKLEKLSDRSWGEAIIPKAYHEPATESDSTRIKCMDKEG